MSTTYATLAIGRVYFYDGIKFEHGKAIKVSKKQAEYLKKNALETFQNVKSGKVVSVYTENKFKFSSEAPDEKNSQEQDSVEQSENSDFANENAPTRNRG